MPPTAPPPSLDPSALIACPTCDALYSARQPQAGARAVCGRCHRVLIAPRSKAGMQIIALSVSVLVLIVGAAMFPFLTIEAGGLANSASILDTALAFTSGPLLALALAVAAVIILIPMLRTLLVLYVLIPVVFDRPPAARATQAFRWAETLRPWSMAEIFALGCAVSLIKLSDLAQVDLGPAFWMFAVLVVLLVVQDSFMCRWSIWTSLETPRRS